VEEVSVMVAERRRKEPRIVPRPWDKVKKAASTSSVVVADNGAVTATGLGGILSVAQQRGAVRLGE
jgi:hypothetical protein